MCFLFANVGGDRGRDAAESPAPMMLHPGQIMCAQGPVYNLQPQVSRLLVGTVQSVKAQRK